METQSGPLMSVEDATYAANRFANFSMPAVQPNPWLWSLEVDSDVMHNATYST